MVGSLVHYLRDPLRFMEMCQRRGDLTRIDLPRMRSYYVASPELIDQVLITQARKVVKDRFLRDLAGFLGQGLLTSEGEHWRRQRRLIQPAFHRERIAGHATTIVESAEQALPRFSTSAVVDVHEIFMDLTLSIVDKTIFSADIGADAPDVGPALETLMSYYADPIGAVLPWVERLPLERNRRYAEAIARLDEIVYGIIGRRRARGAPERTDLLAMLMGARDEDGSAMSDRQIRDEVMTIYLAGHETTAIALSWALYLLADNPSVDERLARELREVLGGRAPTLADLPSLPWTEAVVLEAMRLYPPAWAIGREATEDLELGPYAIERGAQLWMSPWAAHRSPRYFPNPRSFAPERWLDGLQRRLPKHAYFPFGGGPRICIGNAFAQLETTLTLITVVQKLRFRPVAGQRAALMPSITLRPKHGVHLHAEPRRSS